MKERDHLPASACWTLAATWPAQPARCGRGDLGADVVKIENPERGDDGRTAGPPWYNGESAFFLAANRNKRSMALDLKRESGQAVFRRLAARADVVIEELSAGVGLVSLLRQGEQFLHFGLELCFQFLDMAV